MEEINKDTKSFKEIITSFLNKLIESQYFWWLILYIASLLPLYFISKWIQFTPLLKVEAWLAVLISYVIITLVFVIPIFIKRKIDDE